MRKQISVLLWLASGAMLSPSLWAAPSLLVLAQGEQRLLPVAELERFSVGGPHLRATSLKTPQGIRSLLLKGISPGTGDLWVFSKNSPPQHHFVRVETLAPQDLPPRLLRPLSSLEEVEVIPTGAGVILRGDIRSLGEAARVSALLAAPEIRDETELAEPLLIQAHARVERWLESSGFSGQLRTERLGGALWVRGNLEDAATQREVERGAKAAFPLVRMEIGSLPDTAPTVHFRVFLLELKKTRFGAFGLSWPGSQEAAVHVSPSAITQSLALDAAIQAMEGDGSARILSNPELVVRAPGEAELFAGGELPIPRKGYRQSDIVWKNYGLTLQLKVTATTATRVRLDILTEVSHLDTSVGVDKIPGLQANRMKTQVDARYGVPLLLSGLLQRQQREQARGIPGLRDLPVLGPLFGSKDYQNEVSELVAILLPHLTPPPPPDSLRSRITPRGDLPLPENWLSPSEERALRDSPDFPWNAFEPRKR